MSGQRIVRGLSAVRVDTIVYNRDTWVRMRRLYAKFVSIESRCVFLQSERTFDKVVHRPSTWNVHDVLLTWRRGKRSDHVYGVACACVRTYGVCVCACGVV